MKKKVLVVEDEIFIRELYEKVLQGAGYEVTGAQDGQEGLDKVKAGSFDLVLLDIMLPKMTGIDVLKEIKKDPDPKLNKLPVYLLTNLGQESIIKEAFKIGDRIAVLHEGQLHQVGNQAEISQNPATH